MNIIQVKIDFEKGLCQKEGISVVTGDYNSTKIEFEFNESAADGRKIFELKNSDDELVYVDEIVNNEVILVGKREEEGEEKLFSLFNKEGDYTFEVSLYGENSKLTSVYDYITARKEQVIVDDETVEQYMPLFDNLMQELSNKVAEADSKIDEIDQAIEEVNQAVEDAEEAVESTNNLNIDVNKVDKTAQVDLTKKDGTTKTVYINDGTSLQFMWQGTSLGIKTDDMEQYVFVNLQGIQGQPGPQGEPFRIKKTYTSVAEMNADFDNMNVGDYVMIASTVEVEDNAKLYVKGDSQWIFITDFSGAQGIKGETGATPIIRIGTVTSGSTPSVTISGTAEEPVFNFVLQPGQKGEKGDTGLKGDTGNGIASIVKTASAGLIDTYTITFTNGSTTTFNVTNGQDGDVTQEYVDEENERLKSVFNVLPKVSDSGESIELENTGDTILYKMDLKGNTSQEVIQGEVGLEEEDTSIYVDDVNEDKENYITLKGNTSQETTTGKNLFHIDDFNATNHGITLTIKDNTFTLNGTNDGTESVFILSRTPITTGSSTSIKLFIEGGTATNTRAPILYSYVEWENQVQSNITEDVIKPMSANVTYNRYVLGIKGGTFNNYKFSPMIADNLTSTDTYEPYTNGASPNPDYPQEIEVVTGLNEVKVEGKNLFDKNSTTNGFIRANGEIVIPDSNWVYIFRRIKPNTQYVISGISTTNNSIGINNYDKNRNFIRNAIDYRNGTFTTDSSAFYLGISVRVVDVDLFQLEIGSTATTYEEYKGQTYPINLGSIELCKIGTYQDRIYKSNIDNNWYVHKEIGKIVLNGSENWEYDSTYKYFRSPSYVYENLPIANTQYRLSNYFKTISGWGTFRDTTDLNGMYIDATGYKLCFRYITYTTPSDFKTWLSTHNTKVYYVLATPTDTQITDTTLVNQLEALYTANIHTITHINTETSNLLPYIDLKYNVVTASPSPDRASEVEVVTGNNAIKIQSKNLFDKDNANTLNAYFDTSHTTITGISSNRTTYIPCKPNTTYTISQLQAVVFTIGYTEEEPVRDSRVYGIIDAYNGRAKYDGVTRINSTITTGDNAKYLCIRFASFQSSDTLDLDTVAELVLDSIQVESGSNATTYEAYKGQTYPVNLGSIELCKIGTYQDRIYKNNGNWYLHKEIGKVVLNGSEYWVKSNTTTNLDRYSTGITSFPNSSMENFNNGISNYFLWDINERVGTFKTIKNKQSVFFDYADKDTSTLDMFKNWLSTHNTTVYYPLATPTTTQITDQLLVSQLDELQKAMSYYDKTLISQVNDKKPFILDVVAIRDLQDIFNLISGE